MAEIECAVSSTVNSNAAADAVLGAPRDFRGKIDEAIAKAKGLSFNYDGHGGIPPRTDSLETLEYLVAPGGIDLSGADNVELRENRESGVIFLCGGKGDREMACSVPSGGVVTVITADTQGGFPRTHAVFGAVGPHSDARDLIKKIVEDWLFGR